MKPSTLLKLILSAFVGAALALAFASPYFDNETYTALDKFALVFIPAFSLTCIAYYSLPYVAEGLKQIEFQQTLETKEHVRILLGWGLGGVASFFVTAFLSNFYSEPYIVFWAVFSFLIFGILFQHGLGRARDLLQTSPADFGITLFLFALIAAFQIIFFRMGMQFPVLFDANVFLLNGKEIILFAIAGVISLPLLAWTLRRLKEPRLYAGLIENKFSVFIRENLSGIFLSALFFYLYVLIGSVLNFRNFDVDDIFFDSDGFIWRYRLTTEHWQDFYWRSVHPLALLILKPLVNLISVFLNGDLHFAAILLTAFAGAACVFLAWMFMKGVLKNKTAALLMASLLGLSASHLFFGSLIETYIFLAAVTLFFFVLMQKENHSPLLLVAAGVATMGITLTNFAQTIIALFCAKPNIKYIFKYGVLVVTLVVSLTLVSNIFYPNASPYFYVPSSFAAEEQNVRAVSLNRAQALVRAFLFNNIAAPSPLLSHKDIPFTQFRFYRAEDYKISAYNTALQSVTVRVWLALLGIAAFFFIKRFKFHDIRLTVALVGCVLFNLLIHLRYGKELFLYSPNWTYAVVLLLGISWKEPLARRWFQIFFLAFLLLLILNNSALFYTLMEVSVPYIK